MEKEIVNAFIWYANVISEMTEYDNGSDGFCRNHVKKCNKVFLRELKKYIDWENLTQETCSELGFSQWDSDEGIDEKIESLKKPGARYLLYEGQTLEDKIAGLERTKGIWLIPLYLLPIIPIGTELTTIGGETVIYDGHNVDNDIRFGRLAYGIKPIAKERKASSEGLVGQQLKGKENE